MKFIREMMPMSRRPFKKTEAMQQYDEIKKKYPDTIVFFQLGDFYETFYDDAKLTSKVLDITLTARTTKNEKIPLAGVPVKAIDSYLKKLVDEGYKVIVVDQLEDAKKIPSGRIVKRGITRIVTPGTVFEPSILDKNTNNFLLSLYTNEKSKKIGIALVDISTGEFMVNEFQNNIFEEFKNEFSRFKPKELIVPDIAKIGSVQESIEKEIISVSKTIISRINETLFNYDTAEKTLLNHFEVKSLAGYGCGEMVEGIQAAGAIISYLGMLKTDYPSNISSLKTLDNHNYLILDSNTQRNLEIIENAFDGRIEGSLLSVFIDISTSMGARLLRRLLLQPLRDKSIINERLTTIELLLKDVNACEKICELLSKMADFQRLIAKIKYNSANARDLLALKNSLDIGLELKNYLAQLGIECDICRRFASIDKSALVEISELIEKAIQESPPASIREGGIIKPTYNEELAQLYELKNNQDKILNKIKEKEQRRTKFNIKMGYNSVHGYYIEVTKAQLREAGEGAIPSDYVRRQTLVNAERFITPELKEIEEKILNADEKIQNIEYELFCLILDLISPKVPLIRIFSELIAELDVINCFTLTALKNNYCKPIFTDNIAIVIEDGRHPVVENIQKETGFIPNNISLMDGELYIITGPNMSGKSTFIRQVALIVLMAQAGSWVPASKCTLGITDKIFTRIGAFDKLAFGQSTFMLEMLETAHILHNATSQSLIILDEVGRGTSTFDGLSLAWAIAEHIAKEIESKTLFATHYHQLSELEKLSVNIKNYHMTAKERNGELILLYKVQEGSTDHSFGISVAKMAGVPRTIITEAQKKLLELESSSTGKIASLIPDKSTKKFRQLSLAEALSQKIDKHDFEEKFNDLRLEILAFLKHYVTIDINYKTPIEAIQELGQIVKDLQNLEKKIQEM